MWCRQLLVVVVVVQGAVRAVEVHGENTVPTSNWAEVYSSDSTDYREPVVEESQYPVVDGASRSDWFQSYPYHKFEDRKDEEQKPGLLESLGNSVKESVGSVRSSVAGVGEGVVNGALRLVGAETLREKQNAAREGYIYHGTHLRGPGYRHPEGHTSSHTSRDTSSHTSRDTSRDTAVFQGQESQGGQGKRVRNTEQTRPIGERLRQGLRGALDPIKKLLRPGSPKGQKVRPASSQSQQVHRRQQGTKLPNPITGLKDFGSHVAGGFSKLTGLGRGATAKVSSTLFPWLSSGQARASSAPPQHPALPLLPPLYVPATPEQLAEDSSVRMHRVPAPPSPIYVPQQGPPQHASLPLPPHPPQAVQRPPHPPPTRPAASLFPFSLPPLVRRVFSGGAPRPASPPDLRATGSGRALARARPIYARTGQGPHKLGNVMYYLPSPNLSLLDPDLSNVEKRVDNDILLKYYQQEAEKRQDSAQEEVANVDEVASLQEVASFQEEVASFPHSSFSPWQGGTNIQIDLSRAGQAGDAWEQAKLLDSLQLEQELAVVEGDRGVTVSLAPADTLVFDLSEGWGTEEPAATAP